MHYKLVPEVFYKKISEEVVNIVKYTEDDFIYKLNKIAAEMFLLLISKNKSSGEAIQTLMGEHKDASQDILEQVIKDLVELELIVAA